MGNHLKKDSKKQPAKKIEVSVVDKRPKQLLQLRIIFVIGGPGSGKGTQCDLISKEYGLLHVSTGQLLRDEIVANTERGNKVKGMMAKGELVPLAIVLETLKEALLHDAASPSVKGFLIDGYPREVTQGTRFEEEVAPVECAVYLKVSDETMRKRLLRRGQTSGRSDDNEAAINKRLESFHNDTQPVMNHYAAQGKLLTIDADGSVEEVFRRVQETLSKTPSSTKVLQ